MKREKSALEKCWQEIQSERQRAERSEQDRHQAMTWMAGYKRERDEAVMELGKTKEELQSCKVAVTDAKPKLQFAEALPVSNRSGQGA